MPSGLASLSFLQVGMCDRANKTVPCGRRRRTMPKLKFASGFIFTVMCANLWVGGSVGDIAGGLCQPSRRCSPPPPPPPPPPVPRSRGSTPEAPRGGGFAGQGEGLRAACAGVGLALLALLLVAVARWKAAQLWF
ncbi:unnamed protein product [Lampetra planeri]